MKFELKNVFDSKRLALIINLNTFSIFRSEDYVVLEAPEYQPDPDNENSTFSCVNEEGVNGFTNVPECHYVIELVSVCQPRKHIYAIFIILVPVIVLFGTNL